MNTPSKKQVMCSPLLKKGGAHKPSKKQPRKIAKEQISDAIDSWYLNQQAGASKDGGSDQEIYIAAA